jgi:hypothetical protein
MIPLGIRGIFWERKTMQNKMDRRAFLKVSAVAAALPLATRLEGAVPAAKPAALPAGENTDGLTTYQLGPQLWVRLNNRPLTCYRAHRSQKYPYLHPLAGPLSGMSLTDETTLPWPHHRSLFFGCDRVNGGNYWQEDYEKGQVLSTGPKLGKATRDSVEILDACEWQKPGGPVVMKDQRKITVTVAGDRLRFVDWEIEWQAVENVTVLKTNHSLFSMRAALDITPKGGGNLVNAEGDAGEKGTFGKKSAWCDFFGKRANAAGEVVEGIAIFDHPKNPWAPTPWFTRDYGFASPTPMNFVEKQWELAAGKSVSLRYRVVLHAGTPKEAGLDAVYKEWAA